MSSRLVVVAARNAFAVEAEHARAAASAFVAMLLRIAASGHRTGTPPLRFVAGAIFVACDSAVRDHARFGRGVVDVVRRAEPFTAYDLAPVSYTHLRAHETDSYLVCR